MLWSIAGAVSVLLAVLGEEKYAFGGREMLGVSVLFVARGVGTGLGPIIARAISKSDPKRMENLITFGYGLGAGFYMVLPFFDHIGMVLLCIVCAHIGGATIWVFSTIRLQQLVPTQIRGRVFSLEQAAFLAMYILSTGGYSWCLDHLSWSVENTLGIMGATLLLPMIVWMVRMQKVKFQS